MIMAEGLWEVSGPGTRPRSHGRRLVGAVGSTEDGSHQLENMNG
jgi:hypothetical protein